MSNSLGINLRRYRKLRGLTQEDIARKAGLSRVGYRNIETGKSEPHAKTLDELAAVLEVDAFDLIAETPSPQSLRFRAHKRMSAFERAEREEEIVETMNWLSDFNELEALLERKPDCSIRPSRRKLSSIEKFAEQVRQDKFKIDCEECVPNIGDVLEQNGVKVRITGSRIKSFFGFSLGAEDGGPAIVVNRQENIPVERQIFTAAHELGHLLLHQESYGPDETEEDDAQEREANTFASYFLMPKKQFYDEWERNKGLHWVDRVIKTKRAFRVSWMTVLYRLCEDGHADSEIYKKFRNSYRTRYGKKFRYEPDDRPAASSSKAQEPAELDEFDFYEDRFAALVREALEADKISISRAAEMLKISINDTLDLLNDWEAIG